MDEKSKIELWQDRLAQADRAYSEELVKFDRREALYNGDRQISKITKGYKSQKATHVQNIIFENIESMISAAVPMPKVTAKRKRDEHLASIIEHFLRNEMDRLPFERINDMAERTVPIQGGVGFLIDWDNTKRTHDTVGTVTVTAIHPKQFAPQPGVYTGIEDMDWFIIKIPTTKAAIKRRYNKDVFEESESEPEVRRAGGADTAEDIITQYVGYARNDGGGIDRYSWVNDVELEDLENYQARRQPVCSKCGRVKPLPGQIIHNAVQPSGSLEFGEEVIPSDELAAMAGGRMMAGGMADAFMSGAANGTMLSGVEFGSEKHKPKKYNGGACPWCGGEKYSDEEAEFEQVMIPMQTAGGVMIPGAKPMIGPDGVVMMPTLVPFYRPDVYPIVLQKSVSVYGQLLGNSDVDIMADSQNSLNALNKKLLDRMFKAGTRLTMPDRADIRIDPEDGEKIYVGNAADANIIRAIDFTGDISQALALKTELYNEPRNMLGITDSFQGRRDTTAVSGKAKEIAANQSAGRMESKRVMKNAAYAEIFEMMFKFWLAYGDEPRQVSYKDERGDTRYEEFNRYDFIEQDQNGEYYWNDQFLFSCDSTAPLANNREAMWQEMREHLQIGAFGNPQDPQTLLMYWSRMEELHYPTAGEIKAMLEQQIEQMQQQQMMQQQMMAQQQAMAQQMMAGGPMGNVPPEGM